MKKLLLSFALLFTACSPSHDHGNAKTHQPVTLQALNSKNDMQICFDPFQCFFMPAPLAEKVSATQSLDFIKQKMPLQEQDVAIKDAYSQFSPMVAKKIKNIQKSVKNAVTVNKATRMPASVKKGTESADIQVAGEKPEKLKKLCEDSGANSVSIYNSYVHCEWLKEPLSTDSKIRHMQVQVQGELKKGENISVSLNNFDKEAQSELMVQWKVLKGNQNILTSNSSTIMLNNLQPGRYEVSAAVGGTQEETVSLIVE